MGGKGDLVLFFGDLVLLLGVFTAGGGDRQGKTPTENGDHGVGLGYGDSSTPSGRRLIESCWATPSAVRWGDRSGATHRGDGSVPNLPWDIPHIPPFSK